MDFTPKSREEAEKESQFPIWEAGIYDFKIIGDIIMPVSETEI